MKNIATILNTVTKGVHHGETRTLTINPGEPEAMIIAHKIRQLYDQGFFMRATTPGSITKAHPIATVTTENARYLFKKSANGTLSYQTKG